MNFAPCITIFAGNRAVFFSFLGGGMPSRHMSLSETHTYIENCDFPFCAEVSKYEKQAKIGQGTFGEVFKARDKKNKQKIVALKKISVKQ